MTFNCFLGKNLEKAMAPHSSTLAWKIPWTEEPGRLQSMGLLRVGQDWATSLSLFTFLHWKRKWQPTPVFLPGESQGRWSLMGCCLWGRTESDTTEATYSSSSRKELETVPSEKFSWPISCLYKVVFPEALIKINKFKFKKIKFKKKEKKIICLFLWV